MVTVTCQSAAATMVVVHPPGRRASCPSPAGVSRPPHAAPDEGDRSWWPCRAHAAVLPPVHLEADRRLSGRPRPPSGFPAAPDQTGRLQLAPALQQRLSLTEFIDQRFDVICAAMYSRSYRGRKYRGYRIRCRGGRRIHYRRGYRTRYRWGISRLVGHQHQASAVVAVTSLPTAASRLLLGRLNGNTEPFRQIPVGQPPSTTA